MPIAILDTSAANHMPDVLEMPYRPHIIGSGKANEKKFTYRLGAMTCLAGDYIGDYSFDKELKVGDRLVFTDMAIYSFVKTCMFNGIHHPSLSILRQDDTHELLREFRYEDYLNRMD
jgi:carboxynorspermidine decarboxylase